MKAVLLSPVKQLGYLRFWLLVIAAGLIAIHLTLTGRDIDVSAQTMSALYWFVTAYLIWQKRHHLSLDSGMGASLLGIFLLTVVIARSTSFPSSNFLSIFPFLSGLGLSLLASNLQGLKQYWRELVILFFFGVPKVLFEPLINISGLTAQFATFVLWYGGLDAHRQGTKVLLPSDGVNVIRSCSGFNSIFYLLGLAIIFLLLFPLQGVRKNALVLVVAMGLGFIVNGFRIALLAIMANEQNLVAFDYWHLGQGARIFPMIGVTLFGFFCLFLRQHQLSKQKHSTDH
ncbi:MAG: cyanoexosortase A [Thermosynechococcaceae cyanobacterium]